MTDKAFDQKAQVVQGSQTNITGDVHGPVLSGQFKAPVLIAGVSDTLIELVQGIGGLSTDYAGRIRNFLVEYLGRPDRPVPFGGRQAQLAALDAWLNDRSAPPYCVLAAEAGRGKSALLVRWVDSLIKRGMECVIFLPISIRFNTSQAEVTFSALASRLGEVYGEPLRFTSLSAQQWREMCLAYLNRTPPDGNTLLIVLDGLDEASDWRAGPDLFPLAPQPGIRVLVSARYLAGDVDEGGWLKRLRWDSPALARNLPLPTLTREGVSDVLAAMGRPLDQLATQVDVYGQLFRLSQGDPLLVRLYVDALLPYGNRAATLRPENLPSIQEGLAGYFDSWWDDQQQQWRKQGRDPLTEKADVLDFLNVCASALGPISREDVAAIGREHLSSGLRIRGIAADLARFIIGDGQTRGYVFGHPRLGQYFWDQMTDSERDAWETRFIEYGDITLEALQAERFQSDSAPAYVLRYYGAHMERARCVPEKYWRLVQKRWMQASYALEGTYAGFLNDVDRSWRMTQAQGLVFGARGVAGEAIAMQVRCALCNSSVSSLSANIPPRLLSLALKRKVLSPQQALVLARQIPDERKCADALVAIAPDLPEWQLEDVLAATQRFASETTEAWSLGKLAPYLPPALRSLALESARSLNDPVARALAVSRLAPHLDEETQNGALREQLTDIARIEDEQVRSRALKYLASNLPPQSDLLSETRMLAEAIPTPSRRVRILIALAARSQPAERKDLLQNARNAVEEILETNLKVRTLAELARLSDETEKESLLIEVLRLVWQIGDEQKRTDVLALVASDLSRDLLYIAAQVAMGRKNYLKWLGVGTESLRHVLVEVFTPTWIKQLREPTLISFLDRLSEKMESFEKQETGCSVPAVHDTLSEVFGDVIGLNAASDMAAELAQKLDEQVWGHRPLGRIFETGELLRSILARVCGPNWVERVARLNWYTLLRYLSAKALSSSTPDDAEAYHELWWGSPPRELLMEALGHEHVKAALRSALIEAMGEQFSGEAEEVVQKLARLAHERFGWWDIESGLLNALWEEFAPAWIKQFPEQHLAGLMSYLVAELDLASGPTGIAVPLEWRISATENPPFMDRMGVFPLPDAPVLDVERLLTTVSDPSLAATGKEIVAKLSEEQARAFAVELARFVPPFRLEYLSERSRRIELLRQALVDICLPAWIKQMSEDIPALFIQRLLGKVGPQISGMEVERLQEGTWSTLRDLVGDELDRTVAPDLKTELASAMVTYFDTSPQADSSAPELHPRALALLLSCLPPSERDQLCIDIWATVGWQPSDAMWEFLHSADNLPGQIVEEALGLAERSDSPYRRVHSLVRLTPRLDPQQQRLQIADLMRDVRALGNSAEQVEVLIDLAGWPEELLSSADTRTVLEEALRAAQTIGDRSQLIQMMIGLVRELSVEQQADAWPKVLAEIRQVRNPQEQLDILRGVVPVLPEAAATEVFEMAHAIGDALGAIAHVGLLTGLMARLPDVKRPEAAEGIVTRLKQPSERPLVSNDVKEALGIAISYVSLSLIPQALDLSRKLLPADEHVVNLAEVQRRMPESVRQDIMKEIVEATQGHMPFVLEADLLARILDGQVPECKQALVKRLKALADSGAREPWPRIPSLVNLVRYMQEPEKSECLKEVLAGIGYLQAAQASRLYGPLARHFSDDMLRDAYSKAMNISEEGPRARALSSMVAYLPPNLREDATEEVVRVIMDVDAQAATELLKPLVLYLPEQSKEDCIRRILTSAGDRNGRKKAAILSGLLPNLPTACEGAAIELALSVSPPERKVIVLGSLCPRLSRELQAEVLEQALNCIGEVQEAVRLPDALAALMRNVSDVTWQDRILAAANGISAIPLRIRSLGSLTPYLADRTALTEILVQLFTRATGIPERKKRAEILLLLASQLPPTGDLMQDALRMLLQLPAPQRWQGFANLAPRLSTWATEHPEPAYIFWQWTMREISKHARPEFLREIFALQPFTRALTRGDERKKASVAVLNAVQEVSGWWP